MDGNGVTISAFKRYAVKMHNGFASERMYMTGYHACNGNECSVCGKITKEYISFTNDDENEPFEVIVGMGCLSKIKEVEDY